MKSALNKIKNITILGSTGSIGENSLEVISNYPEKYKVVYISANKGIPKLVEQIKKHQPRGVAVMDQAAADVIKNIFGNSIEIFVGEDGLNTIASHPDVDIVVNSLVGFVGLVPTIKAIEKGKRIALANKETLVAAGNIITKMLENSNATIIPIDSEHSAIFQCLVGEDIKNVSRLILTASGGPFWQMDKEKFSMVTIDQALEHPNWKMGSKITIDSATLMNKGLEIIEAHYLFNLPLEKIEVIIHPQSIIHSMVEFIDGSIKAQLGLPDMKIPIQYALTYPERYPSNFLKLNFPELKHLTFFKPDLNKFECLDLAYKALMIGGTSPAILNAANEMAVELFLTKKISFDKIPRIIKKTLDKIRIIQNPELEDIIKADFETRNFIKIELNNLIE